MGFLAEVVAANRRVVEDPGYLSPLPAAPERRPPSLRAAIEAARASGAILAEFKRASPGRADPRLPGRTITEFARAMEAGDATGLSCLATEPRFGGSLWDVLDLARSSPRPLLFKEFVVGPPQIEAARRAGAGAVLLIARLAGSGLLERPLPELAASAHAAGLEVLLELHARAELSLVDGVGADMYGVNVRDLDSLAIDRPTAEATIGAAREAGLRPLLGLSGVETRSDAERFWSAGVDGILVGSSLARSDRPAELLRSLRRASSESR